MKLTAIKVDGGASRSNILMQIQSDLNRSDVIRPKSIETTAMGAAYMAGLAVGFWDSVEEIQKIWQEDQVFTPEMSETDSHSLYKGWKECC